VLLCSEFLNFKHVEEKMKTTQKERFILAAVALVAVAAMVAFAVRADDEDDAIVFRARLTGFQEVPPQLVHAAGTFRGKLSKDGTSISWTLTYTGLTAAAPFAHIHFGERGVNGAVIVFFCGGGGRPACPDSSTPAPHSGTVTGTWTAADVIAVNGPAPAPDQNVAAGDFAGLVRFIRAGDGYANVHTPKHPGGEIRGQVRVHQPGEED
jgi:hypothetical protein